MLPISLHSAHYPATTRVAACLLLFVSCGDSKTSISEISPTLSQLPDAGRTGSNRDAGENSRGERDAFSLTVTGFENKNGAGASITVREDDGAWLDLGGGLNDDGFIQMRLFFRDVGNIVGPHNFPFALPLSAAETNPEVLNAGTVEIASASARWNGIEYYSQEGEALFEVHPDQSISGSFSIAFAALGPLQPGESPAFVLSENVQTLEGRFSGCWNLSCYSRVIAHPTWLPGGAFCDALRL